MFRLRIALAVIATGLFCVDFVIAKAGGEQIDTVVGAGWLIALGWAFGGGVHDAIVRRNGNGDA